MNNFDLISKILIESEIEQVQPVKQSVNVKSDPTILRIKKKAEIVSAKADLMSAQNKIIKVKNDREKINAERQEQKNEMKAKAAQSQPSANQIGGGV